MRTSLWKYFVDEEKTENWLNDLAAEGLHCIGSGTLHRYHFEQGEPGEYTYRIVILEHGIKHAETIRYLAFLRESGIEYVTHGNCHFLFRKKTADGPFDLFTDRESQLKANRTLMHSAIGTALVLLPLMLLNFGVAVWNVSNGHTAAFAFINLAAGLFCAALLAAMCQQWRRYALRIKKLLDESVLYE